MVCAGSCTELGHTYIMLVRYAQTSMADNMPACLCACPVRGCSTQCSAEAPTGQELQETEDKVTMRCTAAATEIVDQQLWVWRRISSIPVRVQEVYSDIVARPAWRLQLAGLAWQGGRY